MSERDRLCDFLCNELWAWVCSDDEEEEDTSLDKLLLQASVKFATSQLPSYGTSQSATLTTTVSTISNTIQASASTSQPNPFPLQLSTSSTHRFTPPKTDEEVSTQWTLGVPKKMLDDTKYCFHLWEEWRNHHTSSSSVHIGNITEMSNCELQHWLTRFILEICKQDGSPPFHLTVYITLLLAWWGTSGGTANLK